MRPAPRVVVASLLLAACHGSAPAPSGDRPPSASARASIAPSASASSAAPVTASASASKLAATSSASSAPPSTSTPLPLTPTTVRITAEEAKRARLPAIGFTIDPGGHALGEATLRFADSYVTLSGPPGGTLVIDVRAYKGAANDATALAAMRARFDKPGFGADVLGAPEQVDLAGAMRPARAAVVGKGMGRSDWCVALVADPGGSDAGLAVFAGVSAGSTTKPSCAAVLASTLGPVLRTLRLTKP